MPLAWRVNAWSLASSAGLLSLVAASACSSSEVGTTPNASAGGSGGVAAGQSGSSPGTAGSSVTTPPSTGGVSTSPQAGAAAGGQAAGGSAGAIGTAGNAGNAGTPTGGATSGGAPAIDPDDTPPWRPLNVTAAMGEHQHGGAGVDTRAPTILGKLVVDIGVNSGGYVSWLAKRGYHSIGAPCGSCAAPNLDGGRDTVGTCRLGEFANTATHVKDTLDMLSKQYPEEDWGYFLNKDGSVRWSDVAITGMSHGATTAAVAGRIAQRMWRVVSRSGPRDDTCGNGGGVCTMPLTTPSFDVACMPKKIASWLDMPSKTPMNRFYGIVGTTDVECGDIMFDMNYAKYPGMPVIFNMPGAVLTGTNQFFTTIGGHLDFLNAAASEKPLNTEAVLNIAFAIPPENQNPKF
jgi:hypothetical protein